jgi:dienelactone hydrolase
LIIFSHSSGGHRRSATLLCFHLARHGYVVAALDHSEVVATELARHDGESSAEQAARIDAVIANRVPDMRFLLDHLLLVGQRGTAAVGAADNVAADIGSADIGATDIGLDEMRIGLVGHSFGGWTVPATPEVEPRVRAVVALAPGGSSQPKPGILPLKLTFAWGRNVPTLYLAAEDDAPIPARRNATNRPPKTAGPPRRARVSRAPSIRAFRRRRIGRPSRRWP